MHVTETTETSSAKSALRSSVIMHSAGLAELCLELGVLGESIILLATLVFTAIPDSAGAMIISKREAVQSIYPSR